MWIVLHPRAALCTRSERSRAVLWWTVFGAGVALTVLTRALRLSDAPAPDDAEAALVGQVLAASGLGTAPSGFSAAALQIAAWTSATGAWDRAPSVLGAAREAMLPIAAVTAVLLWFVARRLGVSRPWAAAALLLLAVCPPLLDAQRTVVAAGVALPWLLGALALAAGPRPVGRRGLARDAGLVACVAVGVLTAPVALALVPSVLWLAVRRRDPVDGAVVAAALTLVATTAAVWVVVSGAGSALAGPAAGNLLVPDRFGVDPGSPVIGASVAVLALGPARTRPLAVGVLGAPVVAVLAGTSWPGLVALAAPVVVLLLASLVGQVVDTAARPVRHLKTVPRHHLYAPVGTAALVVAALAGWSPHLVGLPAALDAGATESARAWLAQNASATDLVVADSRTRLALVSAGDWERTRAQPRTGPVVAQFGEGPDAVRVHAAPDDGLDAGREEQARRAAGELLAGSALLDAPEPVRELLRQGRVNPQAVLTLGTLVSDQRVRLLDLPAVDAEDAAGQPRRHLLLAPVDGGVDRIVEFYLLQRDAYRPVSAVRTTDGVLVSYPPVPEPGLLDPFLPEGPP